MIGRRGVGFAALLCGGTIASAQSIVVQQPVVDVFSMSTVVTVPDRGSLFLGGISTARDQRIRRGFGPLGSSLGMERTHSGAWVSVYIHDLEAMDAALLAAGSPSPPPPPQQPLAAQAYRALWREHTGRSLPAPEPATSAPPLAGSPPIAAPLPAASRLPTGRADSPLAGEALADVPPPAVPAGSTAWGAAAAAPPGVRRWSARFEGSAGTAPAGARERFGSPGPGHSTSASSEASTAANRSTNSGDSPAANRASR